MTPRGVEGSHEYESLEFFVLQRAGRLCSRRQHDGLRPGGARVQHSGRVAAGCLEFFATQSDQQIFFSGDLVAGLRSDGLWGRYAPSDALNALLRGSGLTWSQTRPGVIFLRRSGEALQSAEVATEIEGVIVTGTLLKSSGPPSSPVVTLDRDTLDRRGFATVAEVITDLPQNYAGSSTPVVQLANADRQGSNTIVSTGVNLRGLGPASTLVLINGRRMAGTGFRGEFADISALPSAAVERVDILLDGASALYGADAVAGVVNVILRRAYDGQESRVRVAAAEGGAEDVMASHLAGRAWSSGSAYLSYEYQTTNALSSLDRDYTVDGDLRPFGGTDRRLTFSSPGNIVAFDPAVGGFVAQFAIRPGPSGTAGSPNDFVQGTANLQSPTQGADLVPAIERHGLYGRLRQSMGDRIDVSADVRYNRRHVAFTGGAPIALLTVTRANPWFVSPTGAAAHTIGYSFINDLGNVQQRGLSESFGVSVGAEYDIGASWSLDGYLAYAEETGEVEVTGQVNGLFLNEALGTTADTAATLYRAAADGYFNPFGAGAANPPAVLDFIGSGFTRGRDHSTAVAANLLAEGPLMTLPAGDLQVAIGAQVRRETYQRRGTAFTSTVVPVLDVGPERERTVSAIFAEASIPLIGERQSRPGLRRLDLSLAGRIEEYSDFGTTTNPKLGLVWSPTNDLRLRSSWGTSFRAASLPQTFDPSTVFATFFARPDGSRALGPCSSAAAIPISSRKPRTPSLPASIYTPIGGLTLTGNYFDTRFTDRIARPVTENLTGVLSDPALAGFVTLVQPGSNAADLALVQSFITRPALRRRPLPGDKLRRDRRWSLGQYGSCPRPGRRPRGAVSAGVRRGAARVRRVRVLCPGLRKPDNTDRRGARARRSGGLSCSLALAPRGTLAGCCGGFFPELEPRGRLPRSARCPDRVVGHCRCAGELASGRPARLKACG